MTEQHLYLCGYEYRGMETEGSLAYSEKGVFKAADKAEALWKYHIWRAWRENRKGALSWKSLDDYRKADYAEGGWGFFAYKLNPDPDNERRRDDREGELFDRYYKSLYPAEKKISGEQQKLPCFQCWLETDNKTEVAGNMIFQEGTGWLHFCPDHNREILDSKNPTETITKLIERAKQKQDEGIEYEVWTEGYAATGEHGTATFHGKVKAKSFDEACIKILGKSLDTDIKQPDGYRRSRIGTYSVWACACFNNEVDARKSFG